MTRTAVLCLAGAALLGCFSPVSDVPPVPQKRLVFSSPVQDSDLDTFGRRFWVVAFYSPTPLTGGVSGRIRVSEGLYFIDGLAAALGANGEIFSPPSRYSNDIGPPNNYQDYWLQWESGWYKQTIDPGTTSVRFWRYERDAGTLFRDELAEVQFVRDAGAQDSSHPIRWSVSALRQAAGQPLLCFFEARFDFGSRGTAIDSRTYLAPTLSAVGSRELLAVEGPLTGLAPCQEGVSTALGATVLMADRVVSAEFGTSSGWVGREYLDSGVVRERLPPSNGYLAALQQPTGSLAFASQAYDRVESWSASLEGTFKLADHATLAVNTTLLVPISVTPLRFVASTPIDGGFQLSACGKSTCRPIHEVTWLPVSIGVSDDRGLQIAEYKRDAGVALWHVPVEAWEVDE